MYSKEYRKRSQTVNLELNSEFVEGAKKSLQKTSFYKNISLHFAIMEIEAWLLAMPFVLKRVNSLFNTNIGDPEDCFQPSKSLDSLFPIDGYKKSQDQIEKICSHIASEDLQNLRNSNMCNSFKAFYREVEISLDV